LSNSKVKREYMQGANFSKVHWIYTGSKL